MRSPIALRMIAGVNGGLAAALIPLPVESGKGIIPKGRSACTCRTALSGKMKASEIARVVRTRGPRRCVCAGIRRHLRRSRLR